MLLLVPPAACRTEHAGELECAPATTAARGGQLPALDSVPQGQVVSAVLVWRSRVPREAPRQVRDAGATVAYEFTAQPALLVSATAAQLRRLRGAHPDAELALGVGGTRQICVVGEYVPPAGDRLTAAKRRLRALAKSLLGRD
jgi:hypothetical protein